MTKSLLIDVPLFGAIWTYLVFVIPAFVVCWLKGRWLLFTVGFLTFGVTWFIGALSLGATDSWWYRRFNSEDPDPESAAFGTLQRRRQRRVLLIAVASVVLFGIVTSRPVPIVGVDGESLQSSVGGTLFSDTCEEMKGDAWRCFAYEDSISGEVAYRVKVGPLGCWRARVIDETRGFQVSEPTMDGCLTFFHTGFSRGSDTPDS